MTKDLSKKIMLLEPESAGEMAKKPIFRGLLDRDGMAKFKRPFVLAWIDRPDADSDQSG